MKNLAAKDAKNHFGELLDTARQEPVLIEKNGRGVAVVLSLEEYQRLEALEESYWADQAEKALAEGFIGQKESEKLIQDLLNASH